MSSVAPDIGPVRSGQPSSLPCSNHTGP